MIWRVRNYDICGNANVILTKGWRRYLDEKGKQRLLR